MTLKGLTCEKGHSDWISQPTTAPFRVAESQVSACASWVLPRAFWSKKGLNLVVERFQSSINFIILGSERSWWARLVSPVEVSIKTKVVTTTAWARRSRRAGGARRALQRREGETKRLWIWSQWETTMITGFPWRATQKHALISKAESNPCNNSLLQGILAGMGLKSSWGADNFYIC